MARWKEGMRVWMVEGLTWGTSGLMSLRQCVSFGEAGRQKRGFVIRWGFGGSHVVDVGDQADGGAAMGKQCEVCKEAESKYKCPTCLTPYCSLGCYKKHKEVPCAKSDANVNKAETKVEEQPAASVVAEDDESDHRLKRSQLEAVAASEDIRKMLRDRELQELISKIDSSPNSKLELEKAMEGPAFREFTEKLLSIINPMNEASL